ncbi:hypothetical protein BH09PSE6_BH09PSE6_34340 [soil metagenome]
MGALRRTAGSALLLAVLAVLAAGAPAQAAELWWNYLANFNDKPGSVTVDLSLKPRAPLKHFDHLVVTGIDYDQLRGDGMPDSRTVDTMNKLTERIVGIVKTRTPYAFAGRFMGNGQIRLYLYVQEATGLEDALDEAYTAQCPICRAVTEVNDDEKWTAYRDFLYPNTTTRKFYEADLQKMGVSVD